MIFLTLPGVRIRRRQQCIDFRFLQIGKRVLSRTLERDVPDLATPR